MTLKSLSNRDQMKTKNLSKITIVKRMTLINTVGKKIITSSEIKRKFLIGNAGFFLGKSKKLYIT